MTSWFNTPERLINLEQAAHSWLGTPFVANSRCKGLRGGTSCQMLAEQIYLECGVPLTVPASCGSMRWSGVSTASKIEEAIEKMPELVKMSFTGQEVLPGDLLGFKIGKCLHHLGVALPDGRFIHCMRGLGTVIGMHSDPTFRTRLEKIWRIRP